MSTEGRGTPAFDPASVPRSVWISAGGAAVLLFSVFLTWYSIDIPGGGSVGASGWESVDAAKLVFLAALVALAAWIIELFVPTVALPVPATLIALGAGAVAFLLVLLKIVDKPGDGLGLSLGIWLALLASVAVVAGAYMRMNES
jgi:hypothetical protein